MMNMQAAWAALAFGALLAAPATAAPTTTKDVGDTADFLMQRATCEDFNEALEAFENPKSTEGILTVLLSVVYMEGFAAGSGQGTAGRADVVIRCFKEPGTKFNILAK